MPINNLLFTYKLFVFRHLNSYIITVITTISDLPHLIIHGAIKGNKTH